MTPRDVNILVTITMHKRTPVSPPGRFARLVVEISLGSLAFSTLKSTIDYHVSRISWTWRRLLNRRIEQDYFSDMTYYKVAFVDKRIQSPEQVIVL